MRIKANAILLKVFLVILVASVFSGCCKDPDIVVRTEKVKVPVKCKVPDVNCTITSNDSVEVLGEMLNCIYSYKQAVEVCK